MESASQLGALIVLSAVASAVVGLECYCAYFIDEVEFPSQECQQDNTCIIPNTSVGQCYLERKIFSDGSVTQRYTCQEILSSQIDPSALEHICNRSVVDKDPRSDVACCSRENYCNRNIQLVEHSSPPQTPNSETASAPRGDSKWTVGTIITASVFGVILAVTVVGFLLLYVVLRQRGAVHVV
jgi:hypothetical protein